jgi:hypothetical protein
LNQAETELKTGNKTGTLTDAYNDIVREGEGIVLPPGRNDHGYGYRSEKEVMEFVEYQAEIGVIHIE